MYFGQSVLSNISKDRGQVILDLRWIDVEYVTGKLGLDIIVSSSITGFSIDS